MLHCIAPSGLKLNYLYKTSTCHRQLLLQATHWEYKAIILIVLVHIKLWKSLLFSWMKKDTWFYEVWYLSAKNTRTGDYILRPFMSRSTNSSWLRYCDSHIGEWTGSFLVQVNLSSVRHQIINQTGADICTSNVSFIRYAGRSHRQDEYSQWS